jgi:site-specific DNA recombinase
MRVGLYVRVSTDEQSKDGYSVGAQSKKLQQYAEFSDWDAKLYVDDGYSAKDLKRPQINTLLQDMRDGRINTIVIHKLDRLTRSVKNLHEMLELFERCNCKLISLTESLDTSSASGRFFITMLGAIAQWERETIGERTVVGLKEAARNKKLIGGVPVGYTKVGDKRVIDEPNAQIIRRIFEKYNSGIGAEAIAIELQKNPATSTLRNWETTRIVKILRNRNYLGESKIKFKDGEEYKILNAYPQIIDRELFDSVQKILARRSELHPRQKSDKTKRIFSGLLRCTCGAAINGSHSSGLRYRCSDVATTKCARKTFTEAELEEQFVKVMSSMLRGLNTSDPSEFATERGADKIKLQRELDKIKGVKLKNHTAFENDLITLGDYKKRIYELKEREAELLNLLGQEQQLPRAVAMDIQDFESLWNKLERNDKRNLILKLVKKLTVRKEFYKTQNKTLEIENIVLL